MANRKNTKKLKSELAKEKQLLEAKTEEEAKKLRKQLMKELRAELRETKKRRVAYAKKKYDELEDLRTPEQKELSDRIHKETIEYMEGKTIYSKYGTLMYPHVVWKKYKPKEPNTPRIIHRTLERFIEKETVKPNTTYLKYFDDRDPVPEEVIMTGYKEILASYGIEHLDDYNVRKLFYHTLLSIAHYLDINPQFYLKLTDMHIYKEPLKRNIFTVVIPPYADKFKGTTVESLYQYFVGGDMDIEALHKTLDIYAMSYIKYTETKKALTDKARDSYNRYRLMQDLTDQAKAMLKAQGITGGKGYKKLVKEVYEKLRNEYRMKNRQRIKALREEDERKALEDKSKKNDEQTE